MDGPTLPPLTRYGWSQPFALRKAFADRWGYAVELGGYITEKSLKKIEDPTSDEAKTIALVQSDPDKYKLCVTCARHFPDKRDVPEGTWTRDAEGKLLSAKAKSYDGTEWHPGMKTVISPLAPDALWEECARGRAEPLAAVRVLARTHKTEPVCLLTAWAADGKEREVTVDVPDIGTVKLRARPAGSVYRITKAADGPQVHLLDEDPMLPSISFQD